MTAKEKAELILHTISDETATGRTAREIAEEIIKWEKVLLLYADRSNWHDNGIFKPTVNAGIMVDGKYVESVKWRAAEEVLKERKT